MAEGKYDYLAEQILENVGGKDNIRSVAHCITRLRLKVRDSSAIDEAELKKLGARGVIAKGQAVQEGRSIRWR